MADRLRYARETFTNYRHARDAARAMGIKEQTYAAHENGTRGFRQDSAQRYANFYKVSLVWLWTGRGAPRGKSLDQRVQALDPADQEAVIQIIEAFEIRSGRTDRAS